MALGFRCMDSRILKFESYLQRTFQFEPEREVEAIKS
jgi:hypothetical protein